MRLGRTEIETDKNGFGALPIQRVSHEYAGKLIVKAYENGITYFDTARAYSDSEDKLGRVIKPFRDKIYIATKTGASTAEEFWSHLDTSLKNLQTDYIDVHQFHNPSFCPKPNDGTGLYEAMIEAKKQGKIRFIAITNHRLSVATEAVMSDLYDVLQFPFSYLADGKDEALVNLCKEKDIGFVCMKALSGGLINNAEAAYAFMDLYENALPIWGIQKEEELDEFISFMTNPPTMTDEIKAVIKKDKDELLGEFCRACGYCLSSCPAKIEIPTCARMSLLLRRAPVAGFLTEASQEKMRNIENCISCNSCIEKCPYNLEIPALLRKNYEDYKQFIK